MDFLQMDISKNPQKALSYAFADFPRYSRNSTDAARSGGNSRKPE